MIDDSPLRVVLVVASTRPRRTADALLPWLEDRMRAHDWLKLDVIDLADWPRGDTTETTSRLALADAYVILVPEFNHSFPGVLKDFVDGHFAEWHRKPVTFVSYGGASGGIRAVEQLRLVFPELRAMTTRNTVALPTPWEQIDDAGFNPPEDTEAALTATLGELRWWARVLRDGRSTYPAP